MPDHIHFIASGDNFAKKIRLFKSYAARKMIDHLKDQQRHAILRRLRDHKLAGHEKCDFQLWQEGFHPKQIAGDSIMIQKVDYIHQNPVRKGYVKRPEEWRFSSARNYMNIKGAIPVTRYRR